jgi:hypothetical protein
MRFEPAASAGCSTSIAAASRETDAAAGVVCNGETHAAAKRANGIRTPLLSFRSSSHLNSPITGIRRVGSSAIKSPPPLKVSPSVAHTTLGSTDSTTTEHDDDDENLVTTPATPLSADLPQPTVTSIAFDRHEPSSTAGDSWVRLPSEAALPDSCRAAGTRSINMGLLPSESRCGQRDSSGQESDSQDEADRLEQETSVLPSWDLPRPASRRPAIPEWLPFDPTIETSRHSTPISRPLEQVCAPAGAEPDPCPFPAGHPPDGADGAEPPASIGPEGGRRQVCMEPEVTLISDIRLRT